MFLQNLQIDFAELLTTNINEHSALLSAKNICIYRDTISHHLISHLKNIYPLIVRLVGEDFFKIMAKEYIERYPSCSGNLNDYGEYLSDFIIDYQPVKNLIYLSEVAAFEWICHQLYFAADHPSLAISLFEKIKPEQYDQLYFSLHPAAFVKKFYHPILDIIALCNDTRDNLAINSDGIALLLIRRNFEIALEPLSANDYTFLKFISDHMSISQALKATLMIDSNFNLAEKLGFWIKTNVIVDMMIENK